MKGSGVGRGVKDERKGGMQVVSEREKGREVQ